jgi:hypothetical protein
VADITVTIVLQDERELLTAEVVGLVGAEATTLKAADLWAAVARLAIEHGLDAVADCSCETCRRAAPDFAAAARAFSTLGGVFEIPSLVN